MPDRPDLPWEGGCRCARLRFRIDALPVMATACHCRGCQRMTASAFSTTLITPADGFAVIAGDAVEGGLGGDPVATHLHCPHCKSWVFTRIATMPFVNVRATLLDDAGWFAPFIETYTSAALPWVRTGATHSFAGFPGEAAFPALMSEYAARG